MEIEKQILLTFLSTWIYGSAFYLDNVARELYQTKTVFNNFSLNLQPLQYSVLSYSLVG
jgi:hypothetical protein